MHLGQLGRRLRLRSKGDSLPAFSAPSPYPTVELVSWQPKDGSRNFGDHLSRLVTAGAALEHGLTLEDEVDEQRRLLAVGSILHLARDGDVVWGSGINGKIPLDEFRARSLDVRAVRGPKTAEVLRSMGIPAPNVFGDPALLLPRYFAGHYPLRPQREYIVLPNLNDLDALGGTENLVSPLWGWNRCLRAIVSARFVIASSLHGIILAEAFGVPCRMLRVSENESLFKYEDYAQGTGRDRLAFATSIAEALNLGPDVPAKIDVEPLFAAFPADLWRSRDE